MVKIYIIRFHVSMYQVTANVLCYCMLLICIQVRRYSQQVFEITITSYNLYKFMQVGMDHILLNKD